MSVVPADQFMLAANAVQELNIGVQPTRSGVKHFFLNVVDAEAKCLVRSWFISVNCKPPLISKSFELTLPVCTGASLAAVGSQKRVSYTNPYAAERALTLSTSRDDLLTFKERRIKFGAHEQRTLALKFLPRALPGFAEIYVFINNENDTNEETFALRVHYVQQQQGNYLTS